MIRDAVVSYDLRLLEKGLAQVAQGCHPSWEVRTTWRCICLLRFVCEAGPERSLMQPLFEIYACYFDCDGRHECISDHQISWHLPGATLHYHFAVSTVVRAGVLKQPKDRSCQGH